MQINGFNEGVAFFRIPRELNNALADLPATPETFIQLKSGETLDRAIEYGMVITRAANENDPPDTRLMFQWTPFGLAIKRNFIAQRVMKRRNHTNAFFLSTLLDVIPPHILAGLRNDPPLQNETPGAFFEAVGVCDQYRGVRSLTHFGHRALAAYQAGRLTGVEDAVLLHEFFTPPVRRYMRRVLEHGQMGLSINGDNGHGDARELRAFTAENAGLLLTKDRPHPDYKNRVAYYHYIAPDLVDFVEACTEIDPKPRSAQEVYALFPEKDQYAFMKEYRVGDPQRYILFLKLGWIAKRHGGTFAHTKLGQRRAAQFREQDAVDMDNSRLMRQMERDARPAYVSEELTLDDLPSDELVLWTDDDFDLFNAPAKGDANDDPFDIL